MQNSGTFVDGFAIQIPLGASLIVLVGALFGAWKLAKVIWTAFSSHT